MGHNSQAGHLGWLEAYDSSGLSWAHACSELLGQLGPHWSKRHSARTAGLCSHSLPPTIKPAELVHRAMTCPVTGQEKVSRLLEPGLRTALSGKLLPLSSGGQSRSQGQSRFTGGEIDARSWGRRCRVTLQRAQVQEVWDFIICSGIAYE